MKDKGIHDFEIREDYLSLSKKNDIQKLTKKIKTCLAEFFLDVVHIINIDMVKLLAVCKPIHVKVKDAMQLYDKYI